MRYVTTTLAVIALVAVAIFAIQNLKATEVAFLGWSVNISTCVVIIGAYLLGMVSGWGLVELVKRLFQNN